MNRFTLFLARHPGNDSATDKRRWPVEEERSRRSQSLRCRGRWVRLGNVLEQLFIRRGHRLKAVDAAQLHELLALRRLAGVDEAGPDALDRLVVKGAGVVGDDAAGELLAL